jgi:prophage regulatory protein
MDAEIFKQKADQHARRRVTASTRPTSAPTADRFVRERECREISGLSRSTRWRLQRAGRFPQRRQISPGCTGWLMSEISAWLSERVAAAG